MNGYASHILYFAWLAQKLSEIKPWRKTCFARGGKGKDFRIAAFDVETNGLGGEVIFATAMTEDCSDAVCFSGGDIIGDLFRHMVERNDYVWFAHNAAYDWRYILDYLRGRRDCVAEFGLRSDNAIYSVVVHTAGDDTPLKMRDSYAIWPHTLRKLAFSFCPEFPKGEIDFGRETFNPHKRAHVDYAKRDVEILVRGLRRFNAIILERYGVNLSSTLASTAMRAWERMLDRETVYHNPKTHEKFIRDGYFGGVVFLTRRDKIEREVRTYDINSSYPYQMRQCGVPYGAVWTTRTIHGDKPGLYDVTIGAPDDLRVPIIPMRVSRGRAISVRWPRGIFRTIATGQEIAFARSKGYRLYDVHDGRVWSDLIFPFEEFVKRAEVTRMEFKCRTEEIVAKLIQNALYGKYAARRERRRLVNVGDMEMDSSFEPWDDSGHYYVKREYAEDLVCLPQWSVFITANARLHLLRTVYDDLGVENVIYGDTDSVTTFGHLKSGKAYGDFKLEKTWIKFRAIAPKVYAGQLEDGTWAGAAKGIPTGDRNGEYDVWWRNQLIFKELYETGQVREKIDILPSLMVAMKTGNSDIRTIFRKSTDIANSGSWQAEGDEIRPRYAAG